MTKAKVVGFVESIGMKGYGQRTRNPMQRTIIMAIKKEKARKAKCATPEPFNGINVTPPAHVFPGFAGCVMCRKTFDRPEGLETHHRMKHGRE